VTINVIAKPIEVNADSTRNIVNEKREKVGVEEEKEEEEEEERE
jgi:hypothetical protein